MPEGIWAATFAALWVLLLAEGAMVVVLSRHMRSLFIARSPDPADFGPVLGSPAPEIEATDITGRSMSLGGAYPVKRLLIFLSPGCSACRTAIREVQQVPLDLVEMVLLWSADLVKTRGLAEEYDIRLPMVGDGDQRLWKAFNISVVPFALVVDEMGRVTAKAFAHRAEQLVALLTPPEPVESAPDPAAPSSAAVAVTK